MRPEVAELLARAQADAARKSKPKPAPVPQTYASYHTLCTAMGDKARPIYMQGLASLFLWCLEGNRMPFASIVLWATPAELYEADDGLWYGTLRVGRGYLLTGGCLTEVEACDAVGALIAEFARGR